MIGRRGSFRRAGLVLAIALLPLVPATARSGSVAIVSAERFVVDVDGHDLEIPFVASQPIHQADPSIERLVVVIHGSSRNSEDYLARVARAATRVPGLSKKTLIVAPQFLQEQDVEAWGLTSATLYWGYGWRRGDRSWDTVANPRPARISSFAVLDALLDQILEPGRFANLAAIVIAGHSAGGQFVHRFAAGSPSEVMHSDRSFRYLVANPSSYTYFDDTRRTPGMTDHFTLPSESEREGCPDYDHYRYGLEDLNTYMAGVGADLIPLRYADRRVDYLLGALDTVVDSGLDIGCAAMLQGTHRLERGTIYFNHTLHHFGAGILDLHSKRVVENVGHSSTGIFLSAEAREVLFDHAFEPTSGSYEILVADPRGAGRIVRIDPTTGDQSLLASGGLLDDPSDVALLERRIYVVDEEGLVVEIDPESGEQALVASGGRLRRPQAIVARDSGRLLVADAGARELIAIDPESGAQISPCPELDLGLEGELFATEDPAGHILISDARTEDVADGAIIRVDLERCERTIVSENARFFDPGGIAYDAAAERIIVADGSGDIHSVDPVTGAQSTLCQALAGPPRGIAIEPAGSILSVGLDHGPLVRDCSTVVSDFGLLEASRGLAIRPLPEPGGLLQLGVGICALGWIGRRGRCDDEEA